MFKAKDTSHINWNEYFNYDPKTGELSYKSTGKVIIMANDQGYRRVSLGHNKHYRQHRVIWEMHWGAIPEGWFIDHVNADVSDNRLQNLRLVTHGWNMANKRKKPNQCGYGIEYDQDRGFWLLTLHVNEFGGGHAERHTCLQDAIDHAVEFFQLGKAA